jgi:hypothetical protein
MFHQTESSICSGPGGGRRPCLPGLKAADRNANRPALFAFALLATATLQAATPAIPANAHAFIDTHCASCHDAVEKEGGLDLTALPFRPEDPRNLAKWVKVFDRVTDGEMPPAKKPRPPAGELTPFLTSLSHTIVTAEQATSTREGRAVRRRLNRYEYENTLRELLALPALAVRDTLPEDSLAHGFNKLGEALDVSHIHLARYLGVAETALRAALTPQIDRPPTTTTRYYTWDSPSFIRTAGPKIRMTFPVVGLELQHELVPKGPAAKGFKRPVLNSSTDPVRREQEAVTMLMSTYEPAEITFNRFRAPVTGRYRLRLSAYTLWMALDFSKVSRGHRGEPVTLYAETPPRQLRLLGSVDIGTDPTVREIDVWLLAGETIRPDAARLVRARPPDFKNPLAEADGMPGVAFQWLEVEGPLIDQWPSAGHRLLFGDLPLTEKPADSRNTRRGAVASRVIEVESKDQEADAARLMRNFVTHAFRHPVEPREIERYLAVVRSSLGQGYNFTDAMIAGYTAVLSSPEFVFVADRPGALDRHALAERLSYFLWNSPPDATLRDLAANGSILKPDVLRAQANRLLDDPRASRFHEAFLDYWLDLRQMGASGPDAGLYPEYQLDDLLVESMVAEPRRYFAELVKHNLGVRHLVASEFAMLNERLATLYGIPGVQGVALQRVPLPPDSVRGGFLTQGAVLKVTANGTTTSPVVRGAWIMGRLLGRPPPPPPAAVPAVDPDIRGATTIREQLSKHRAEESCAACHRNIDPPGFALESFDVMGGWRTRYRSVGEGVPVTGFGHDGLKFTYRTGPAVDPSGEMPDGRPFADIRSFRANLLADEPGLARNVAQQLAIYATGAPIRFSDRAAIDRIVAQTRSSGYGTRDLIHAIIQSDLFLQK